MASNGAINFTLSGQDVSASSTFKKVADSAEDSSSKAGNAFSSFTDKAGGLFSKLGDKIGGEFGEISNAVGEGLSKLGEHADSVGKGMAIAGGAAVGLGAALTLMGGSEEQASKQLEAAIDATGQTASDYSDKIEETIKQQENFAHSSADTTDALRVLTTATQDPTVAIQDMGLVADIAAAKNISLAAAAQLVAKIYSGNSKVLKSFGIDMKVTAGDTDSVNAALEALSQRVDGQAKASVSGYSGQLDILRVKLGDAAAQLGNEFGPTIVTVGGIVTAAGEVLDTGLAQKVGRGVKSFLGFGEAAADAASAVAASAAAVEATTAAETAAVVEGAAEQAAATEAAGTSSRSFGSKLGGAMLAVTPLVLAGSAAALGIGYAWAQAAQKSAQIAAATDSLTQAFAADNNEVGKNVVMWERQALQSVGALDVLTKAGVSVEQYTKYLDGNTEGMTKNQLAAALLASKVQDMTKIKSGDFKDAEQKNKDLTASELLEAKATDDAATATNAASTAYKDATTAASNYKTALDNVNGIGEDATKAQLSFSSSVTAVTASVKDGNATLDINTAAGQSNYSAILNAIDAAKAHAAAVYAQTDSVDAANAALAGDEASLYTTAAAAGYNTSQVASMIGTYGKVPSYIDTTIHLSAGDAIAALQTFSGYLDSIGGFQSTAGHASGTDFSSGGMAWVGEQGPELVNLPAGSQVHTASASKSVGGGGDVYLTVNAGMGTDGHALGGQLVGILETYFNRGGTGNFRGLKT